MSTKGTPATLRQAIENGANEATDHRDLASTIEAHVLDFLRQKFGAAYLLADELDGDAATASLNAVRTLAIKLGVEKPWCGPAEVAALEAAIAAGEIGPKARRS